MHSKIPGASSIQDWQVIKIILFFREDFHYDNGNKTGKAVLRGASGAIREGNDFFRLCAVGGSLTFLSSYCQTNSYSCW